MRWDDDRREFEPLPPWVPYAIGIVVGFALCYLIFVS